MIKAFTYLKWWLLYLMVSLVLPSGCTSANTTAQSMDKVGLKLNCEETKVRITVKREFFEKRGIPFIPGYLQFGVNSKVSCRPVSEGPISKSEMVIYAGLQECGTQSRVSGEWLVYFNQLVLSPAVIPTSPVSLIVRGATTIIPVECYYKRKQRVSGESLTPTWLPMIFTFSAFGLLRFSLHTMTDDWSSPRSSSVYQQGEPVLLEASVEAPLHPPLRIYVDYCVATLNPDPLSSPRYRFITKHGCLVDSVVPGSSSRFFPRESDNRLRFSVQAFHFNKQSGDRIFINCHLRATLKRNPSDHLDKACFFHRHTFSWRTTEGDSALCQCCDTEDCFRQTGVKTDGHTRHTTQLETEEEREADLTVGPLQTLPKSHWTGHLSFNH